MTGLWKNPPQRILNDLGCNKALWFELRDLGLELESRGFTYERTPIAAFRKHRGGTALRKGVGFELTLEQWWAIWSASGHFEERSHDGFHMCRKGDIGPYAVGNIYIGPASENFSAVLKKADLPIGVAVSRSRTNPFRAFRSIKHRQVHLGLWPTAEAAHAARLADDNKRRA